MNVTMRRLVLAILVVVSILAVNACAYPKTSVKAVEENPSLVFKGAPPTAQVRVDGLDAGPAADYSGDRSLTVLPGRHVVEVIDQGKLLLREDVFLSSGSIKTLTVGVPE